MQDGGSQTRNSYIVANSNGNNHVFKVEEFSKAISHAYCVMLVGVKNPSWRLWNRTYLFPNIRSIVGTLKD